MRGSLAAIAVSLATGCTTVTPGSFASEAPAIAAKWPGAVSITAVHRSDPASRFNANGDVSEIDLNAFSDELARLVRESLAKGGTSTSIGDKTLAVQVIYLDFLFQGPCLVDYRVELGNGEVFGAQSSGDSASYTQGCRSAFESAVRQIVSDARTIAYAGAR